MSIGKELIGVHPEGETDLVVGRSRERAGPLDTFGGPIHVKWDESAAVTPLGQMAFFVEFLKTAGLWDALVKDCPLSWTSHNAPGKAVCSAQFCCRFWLGIAGTRTSRRCASTE